MNDPKSKEIPAAVAAALDQGRKLEAIKLFRETGPRGLKEAKEAVEDYIRGRPELQRKMALAQAEAVRGFLRWVVVLAAVAIGAGYYILSAGS